MVTTAVIGGAFSATSAFLGIVFGTFVDRHRKKTIMLASTTTSLSYYTLATIIYALVDRGDLLRLTNVAFWVFVFAILAGSVAGNMRSIALSTCVTLLVAEPERARANGMVGTVTGVSFAITSVFSGLVVGRLGMGWTLGFALAVTLTALLHLITITVDEPARAASVAVQGDAASHDDDHRWIDVRGALESIRATPGLI
ncbi:MAG: MFS transporter [Acidimicrobiales bacterium]